VTAVAERPPLTPRRNGPLSRKNLLATITTGYVPIVLATAVVVLPLLWMVLASFKSSGELLTQTPSVLPDSFAPTNYADAAERVPFGRLFLNSTLVTVVGAGIKVVLAVLTAYALVFVRFPFKKVIFALILATGFGTFLLRQQFLTLPASILEAAEIDGASHWKRLTRIVVPISTPAIATVALVNIVFEWNEYLWPLVIVSDPQMMTLPVGLTLLFNSENGADAYGVLMAGTVMVIVPVLVVFAAFQRYIVSGLTQGAVKD
jgi:sn-glycerol 3-phosphate transport system permease protein